MRNLLTSFLLLVGVLGLAGLAQAGSPLILEKTFAVPGQTLGKQLKFYPSTSGRSPLYLAVDPDSIFLIEIATDSILVSLHADSLYEFVGAEYGDVNRDSIADLAVVRTAVGPYVEFPPRYEIWLDVYNSCNPGNRQSRLVDTGGAYGEGNPATLAARDFNADGHNELLVSSERLFSVGYPYLLLTYYTDGELWMYYSTPDSLSVRQDCYARGVHDLGAVSGRQVFAVARGSKSRQWGMGYDFDAQLQIILTCGEKGAGGQLAARVHSNPMLCDMETFANTTEFACTGRLSSSGSGMELLTQFHWSYSCYLSQPHESFDSTYLELRSLDTDTSASLIWSRDITGASYTAFLYDLALPGKFFAFSEDTLMMFNGADGSVNREICVGPTGTKSWAYLYDDSMPRLVVQNGLTISIYRFDISLDVDDNPSDKSLPASFALDDPYPNPFNPSSNIEFALPKSSHVTLEVFNVLGQKVATLIDQRLNAGRHRAEWGGTDAQGNTVSSGVYLYRLTAGEFVATKKMVLLK